MESLTLAAKKGNKTLKDSLKLTGTNHLVVRILSARKAEVRSLAGEQKDGFLTYTFEVFFIHKSGNMEYRTREICKLSSLTFRYHEETQIGIVTSQDVHKMFYTFFGNLKENDIIKNDLAIHII